MAAQRKKVDPINLLPSLQIASSDVKNRVLLWLVSTFRKIVIFTEVIVVICLGIRFYLDARSNELNSKISSGSDILTSFAPFEKDFRNTQNKLTAFAFVDGQSDFVSEVSKISSSLTPDMLLTSINYSQTGFVLNGETLSENSILQFMSNLKSSGAFVDISLTNLQKLQTDGSITFGLALTLQKG